MKKILDKITILRESEFASNWTIRAFIGLSFLFISTMIALLLVYWRPTDQPMPHVFTSFNGAVEAGAWFVIYQLPFFSLLVLSVNTFFAYQIFKKEPLVSYVLSGGSMLTCLIFLIDTVNFVSLVR